MYLIHYFVNKFSFYRQFSFGNAEATRKILKKHAKRTALPLVLCSTMSAPPRALLSDATTSSLSRTLVQAIGQTLIPIIPHIDDYCCLICTSIAFKPIRLTCGHLFCVRCLVKMQKRNKNLCPLCRAPSVLAANRGKCGTAPIRECKCKFVFVR